MKISEKGKDLIKFFEGCRLETYKCSSNVLTIGWGHTKGVKEGQVITQEEADKLFSKDMEYYEEQVNNLHIEGLNQNQFDALVSFNYNCGIWNLKTSTLLVLVKANPKNPNIEYEFAKWRMGGKPLVVLPGLVKRRKYEADLYFSLAYVLK